MSAQSYTNKEMKMNMNAVETIREQVMEYVVADNAKRAPLIKSTAKEFIMRGARFSDKLKELYGNGTYRERSYATFLRDMSYMGEALEKSPLYNTNDMQLRGFGASMLEFDNTTNEYEDGLKFVYRMFIEHTADEGVLKLMDDLLTHYTETGNFTLEDMTHQWHPRTNCLEVRGHAVPNRIVHGPDGMFVKLAASVESELDNPKLRRISDFLYSTELERRPDGSVGSKDATSKKKGR